MFPLDDNIPVVLPIDEPEHERLSKQHRYLKLLLGSNYFGPFREVMDRLPTPRVLDIRTQEGSWCVPSPSLPSSFPSNLFCGYGV